MKQTLALPNAVLGWYRRGMERIFFIFFSVGLWSLSACATIPAVDPPNPTARPTTVIVELPTEPTVTTQTPQPATPTLEPTQSKSLELVVPESIYDCDVTNDVSTLRIGAVATVDYTAKRYRLNKKFGISIVMRNHCLVCCYR